MMLDINGGVNLLKGPRKIADNEVVRATNIFPVQSGIPSTRGALTWRAPLARSPFSELYPLSAGLVPFISATDIVAAVYDPYVEETWLRGEGVEVSLHAVCRKPQFVSFNQKLYVFPGYPFNQAGKVITPGAVVADVNDMIWAGTGNTFAPATASAYRFRMVYGNLGPGYENYIVFSDRYTPEIIGNDVLAANGRAIQVGNRDGDVIVALVEVLMTGVGSPAQSALLVLKRYSAYVVTGEPNETTDSTDPYATLEVGRITFDCGCASPETVASTPYGTVWAGPDDVWLFDTGQVPRRIGTKIRKALQQGLVELQFKWTGAYFDGVYRLAVYSAAQDMDMQAPLGEQWWLDLREGPPADAAPARWWGPQKFSLSTALDTPATVGTRVMLVETRKDREIVLYGIERSVNVADESNIAIVQYDTSSARDLVVTALDACHIVGTEIDTEIVTREFDLGIPLLDKLYERMSLNLSNDSIGRLQLDATMDTGRARDTSSVVVDVTGFVANVDTMDGTARFSHQTQSVSIWPSDPAVRNYGKTFQLRLYTTAEIVIDDSNDTLIIRTNIDGFDCFAVVPHGTYADIAAFLDALVLAMRDALPSGSTFTHNGHVSPRDALIEIDIDTGASTWQYLFTDDSGLPTTPLETYRKSRMIGMLLGFDTEVNPVLAPALTAVYSVYYTHTPIWEFYALDVKASVLPREP